MTKETDPMKTLVTALAALALATPAAAQTMAARYGGHIAMAGDVHVEVAFRDGGLRAWVRDHADKPVAATGKATLLTGGKKLDVALTADGEALVAEAPVQAGDKVTAVLTLAVAGKPVSARFAQEAVVMPAVPASLHGAARTFAEVCSACHGATLRGTDAGPPLLHPNYAPGSGHPDEMLMASIANGTGAHHWQFGDMPKPDIKPGQEKDLLAYIRAVQAANGMGGGTTTAAPAPMPAMDHSKMDHSRH